MPGMRRSILYTGNVKRIDKVMQKFHDSSLRVHPLAAGEISLNEIEL
ncbi:hypothetical protein [Methanolobus bombayensis]|nr:hypothetical protein [Methanolobus bombayensis]MBP1910424.1 hypothetical protein [Methanolobus bombayensis]